MKFKGLNKIFKKDEPFEEKTVILHMHEIPLYSKIIFQPGDLDFECPKPITRSAWEKWNTEAMNSILLAMHFGMKIYGVKTS